MNTEQYIASGILEAYALGELSLQEQQEVERNLALYPQLKEELLRIEQTQEALLMHAAIPPRDAVKQRVFEKISQEVSEAKVVPLTTSVVYWKYAVAASVSLFVLASFLAYTYYSRWRTTQSDLNELIAQNQQMAKDYNNVNQRLDKIESDLKVVDNPAFTRVVMKGTENAPEAMAYVYWNQQTTEVYLRVQSLKQLTQENQYQLWAIVGGKPVDAGVFDGLENGLLKMNQLTGAEAFAVTIEPRGGRKTPTLETMQVIGNIPKNTAI